jgi:fumarate hydratase class I
LIKFSDNQRLPQQVEDMPVTVAVDSRGDAVHKTGSAFWQKEIKKMQE